MEGLLDKLTDDYRKCKVAERKSIRAIINWCSGMVQTDKDVEGQLLTMVLSGSETGAATLDAATAEAPANPQPKPRPVDKFEDGLGDLDLDRSPLGSKGRRRKS
jgi:cytochrome P450